MCMLSKKNLQFKCKVKVSQFHCYKCHNAQSVRKLKNMARQIVPLNIKLTEYKDIKYYYTM